MHLPCDPAAARPVLEAIAFFASGLLRSGQKKTPPRGRSWLQLDQSSVCQRYRHWAGNDHVVDDPHVDKCQGFL